MTGTAALSGTPAPTVSRDWYGVDYGMPIPVRSVEVLMGRNDKDGDYVEKGQLEGSRDLKT
ncbi:MAG: hypothetical protein ACLSUW_01410 [Akkermansia sp.]